MKAEQIEKAAHMLRERSNVARLLKQSEDQQVKKQVFIDDPISKSPGLFVPHEEWLQILRYRLSRIDEDLGFLGVEHDKEPDK